MASVAGLNNLGEHRNMASDGRSGSRGLSGNSQSAGRESRVAQHSTREKELRGELC